MKNFILYVLFLSLLSSCKSAGFTLKDEVSDEFLVEKKNPLVMPPEYNDLPVPEDFQNQTKDEEEFEKIINNAKNLKTGKSIKKTNIEQSVLEKIN